jgi:hypothetical protein
MKQVKKTKRDRKDEWGLSGDDRELVDRLLVGVGLPMPSGQPSPSHLWSYILNPKMRGPDRLDVHEATAWPAFFAMPIHTDEKMREKLRVDDDVFPYCMGRFIAFTERDFVLGYTSIERPKGVIWIRTVGFDYSCSKELFGDGFENMCVEHAGKRVSRAMLNRTIDMLRRVLSGMGGIPCETRDAQGIDPGVNNTSIFPSRGGAA